MKALIWTSIFGWNWGVSCTMLNCLILVHTIAMVFDRPFYLVKNEIWISWCGKFVSKCFSDSMSIIALFLNLLLSRANRTLLQKNVSDSSLARHLYTRKTEQISPLLWDSLFYIFEVMLKCILQFLCLEKSAWEVIHLQLSYSEQENTLYVIVGEREHQHIGIEYKLQSDSKSPYSTSRLRSLTSRTE